MPERLALEHLIKLAAIKEAEAQQTYLGAIDLADEQEAKMLLRQLAAEELAHKEDLEKLDASGLAIDEDRAQRICKDLDADDSPVAPDVTFCDVIKYAIDREEQATHFYTNLAEATTGAAEREFLSRLAEVERGHKSRLEALCHKLKL